MFFFLQKAKKLCTWTSRTTEFVIMNCRVKHPDCWIHIISKAKKIKTIITRPAACCLPSTLHYTHSFWYLKHKICKKCTFQKLWKSAINVQLFTTQKVVSQTESSPLAPICVLLICPTKVFACTSPSLKSLTQLYSHSWQCTLMRNMAFTKVEQITMIANDKYLWVKGSWKTIFSDEPLFSFFLQQTFCVQNECLDFSSYKTFHVKTKGNSGSLLQKANVFAFMISKSDGKELKTSFCWGKMSTLFSRKTAGK